MLNEARLIGRIGNDPQLLEMGGKPFVRLRLATTYRGTKTTWHDVVVWGPRAKACAEYLRKGRRVYVAGRMQTRTWKDAAGVKHYRTEVVASNVLFLDKPDSSSGPRDSTDPDDGGERSGDPVEIGIPKDLAFLLDPGAEDVDPPF